MQTVIRNTAICLLIALGGFVPALLATPSSAVAELTARANHDRISVGFFYNGSTVSVSGVSEPGTDLIVKISAPDASLALKQKGKVAGLLWMNVGTLEFGNVPPLYFLASTKPVEDLLSRDERRRYGIGYAALQQNVLIEPLSDEKERDKWFSEYVSYRESMHLYTVKKGGFSLEQVDDAQRYRVVFDWPYQALPGTYQVTVYAVRDGKVAETANSSVVVEQVGGVSYLATTAKKHGAFYGLLSVVAALTAGFGVGMIFRKGGGAH